MWCCVILGYLWLMLSCESVACDLIVRLIQNIAKTFSINGVENISIFLKKSLFTQIEFDVNLGFRCLSSWLRWWRRILPRFVKIFICMTVGFLTGQINGVVYILLYVYICQLSISWCWGICFVSLLIFNVLKISNESHGSIFCVASCL